MDISYRFRKKNSAEFYSLENLHHLCKAKLLDVAYPWHFSLSTSILSKHLIFKKFSRQVNLKKVKQSLVIFEKDKIKSSLVILNIFCK